MKNYNAQLINEESPLARRYGTTKNDYDPQFDLQAGRINVSKINIDDFIRLGDPVAGVGTFSTSASLSFYSIFSYSKPWADAKMFAIPFMSIYQGVGTVGTNEIWPVKGSGVTAGRYDVQAGFDYANWNGTTSRFGGMITDTNGTSTQAVTVGVRWWHPDYKSSQGSS